MNKPPRSPKTGNTLLDLFFSKLDTFLVEVAAGLRALLEPEVHVVSGNTVIEPAWDVVEYNGPGGHKLTIPSAARIPGRRSRPLTILNTGVGGVTLVAQSGETIDPDQAGIASAAALTALVVPPNSAAFLRSNGNATWISMGPGAVLGSLHVAAPQLDPVTHFPVLIQVGGVNWFACRSGSAGNQYIQAYKLLSCSGGIELANAQAITSGAGATGVRLGAANTEKWGRRGSTPVVQPVMATGTGKTVDDLIAMLQSIGDCRQS